MLALVNGLLEVSRDQLKRRVMEPKRKFRDTERDRLNTWSEHKAHEAKLRTRGWTLLAVAFGVASLSLRGPRGGGQPRGHDAAVLTRPSPEQVDMAAALATASTLLILGIVLIVTAHNIRACAQTEERMILLSPRLVFGLCGMSEQRTVLLTARRLAVAGMTCVAIGGAAPVLERFVL